jgi:hypothetical protein
MPYGNLVVFEIEAQCLVHLTKQNCGTILSASVILFVA